MSQDTSGFIRLPTAVDLPLTTTAFIKPEWIIEGEAREQGHILYNNEERNVQVGYWQCTAFRETIVFPYDELGIVLAGRLQLADEGGRSAIFEPGQMFFIPRGRVTTWHILEYFRQYYMIYAPRDTQYFKF
jgi:uncharacterized cupin superfamily protein